jgi:hypothetical protein
MLLEKRRRANGLTLGVIVLLSLSVGTLSAAVQHLGAQRLADPECEHTICKGAQCVATDIDYNCRLEGGICKQEECKVGS